MASGTKAERVKKIEDKQSLLRPSIKKRIVLAGSGFCRLAFSSTRNLLRDGLRSWFSLKQICLTRIFKLKIKSVGKEFFSAAKFVWLKLKSLFYERRIRNRRSEARFSFGGVKSDLEVGGCLITSHCQNAKKLVGIAKIILSKNDIIINIG